MVCRILLNFIISLIKVKLMCVIEAHREKILVKKHFILHALYVNVNSLSNKRVYMLSVLLLSLVLISGQFISIIFKI